MKIHHQRSGNHRNQCAMKTTIKRCFLALALLHAAEASFQVRPPHAIRARPKQACAARPRGIVKNLFPGIALQAAMIADETITMPIASMGATTVVSAMTNACFVAALAVTYVLSEHLLLQTNPRTAMTIAGQGVSMMSDNSDAVSWQGSWKPSPDELGNEMADDACYIISPANKYHKEQHICWGTPDPQEECVLDEDLTEHYGKPVFHCMAAA